MLLYVNAIWFGDYKNERRAGRTSKNAITWDGTELYVFFWAANEAGKERHSSHERDLISVCYFAHGEILISGNSGPKRKDSLEVTPGFS